MPHTVYALLIGIDAYPMPVQPLRGCVNDVVALAAYLHRQHAAKVFDLQLVTLLHEAATRAAVIAEFRTHLGRAGTADTVLFYFSGHGSQQQAPRELWHLEPDRLNETLVCWDSRTAAGWDLADKELALLIAEVAARGCHVLVVLDCCHSGTGTRTGSHDDSTIGNVRAIPADERPRPLSTFLFASAATAQSRTVTSIGWEQIPRGRHVLFAACADRQLAYEYRIDGTSYGGFSYFLGKVLDAAGPGVTYRDLFKRTAAHLGRTHLPQTPQMEATEPADLGLPFLGAVIRPRLPTFTVSYRDAIGWVVDAGALHGLPSRVQAMPLRLALYPFQATSDPFMGEDLPIRRVTVARVAPHFSHIDPQTMTGVDPAETFQALLVEHPLPPLAVDFVGEAQGLAHIHHLLQRVGFPQIRTGDANTADIQLIAQEEMYVITRPGAPQPIVRIPSSAPASAGTVLRWLWQIARWQSIARLENPAPRYLKPDQIAMEISRVYRPSGPAGDPGTPATHLLWSNTTGQSERHVRITYTYANATWQHPKFEVMLTNSAHLSLYCACLALTEDCSMVNLLPGACLRLGPGAMTRIRLGGEVPDALWAAGVTETVSLLKLIVCTAEFDATLFEQTHALGDAADEQREVVPSDQHADRSNARKITRLDDVEEDAEDWIVNTIVITIVRPIEIEPDMDKSLLFREYSS